MESGRERDRGERRREKSGIEGESGREHGRERASMGEKERERERGREGVTRGRE